KEGRLAGPRRHETYVEARTSGTSVCLHCKVGISGVNPGRRELPNLPVEQAQRLPSRPPDRGGGGDHLWADSIATAEEVDRRLVKPGQRSKRPRDEVQFILDNQFQSVRIATQQVQQ